MHEQLTPLQQADVFFCHRTVLHSSFLQAARWLGTLQHAVIADATADTALYLLCAAHAETVVSDSVSAAGGVGTRHI
jgi:hypothetical protein